jgi:hypothetical protein
MERHLRGRAGAVGVADQKRPAADRPGQVARRADELPGAAGYLIGEPRRPGEQAAARVDNKGVPLSVSLPLVAAAAGMAGAAEMASAVPATSSAHDVARFMNLSRGRPPPSGGDHLVWAGARCRGGPGGAGHRCRDQRSGEATCDLQHRRTSRFK